jgi:DNA invertase Pin-like site-specific DNA recombinase
MKKIKTCAIYARVSTEEQNPDHQIDELKIMSSQQNYMIYKIYVDKVSGTKSSRPALMELMKDAHDRKFEVVLTWKLDRLGRSLQHLIKLVNYFRDWGIDFICTTQNIDTTTSSGKLVFHVMGAMAEYERELISERTKAGLKKAKNVGKRGKDKKQRKKGGYYQRYQKKGTTDFYDLDLM